MATTGHESESINVGGLKSSLQALKTKYIDDLEEAIGTGGSVDTRIADAKTEIIGGATSDGNTLKKLEDRVSPLETAIGSGGSIDTRIETAIDALDSSASQSAGTDGLALSITETNGKITAISGSITANTYDTYGSASAAQTAAISAAATDATNKVNAAKSEIKGNATSACDTLGEAEALISAEKTRAQNAESTLQSNINAETTARANAVSAEASRAQAKEQLLQEQYNALTQSDIIIGTLPSSGTKNKIYRVPGTTSYSDYMWNGSSFVKMAEYNNAIDDEPTGNSNNLVKSGGVSKFLFNKFIKGAGRTYVEIPTYGLISNHTYYLFIKDTNWAIPSGMHSSENKLAIDSVYNSTKTALHQFGRDSVVPQPISFTIPENSDYLLVGGRAAVGTNIEFYISDTNPQEAESLKINIFNFEFTQGSVYNGVLDPTNTECISSDYKEINLFSFNQYLLINNEKQRDGKYWKVRISYFDFNYSFISQEEYFFVEGDAYSYFPDNTESFRVSISLCNESGQAIGCTPSDLPIDGTKISIIFKDVRDYTYKHLLNKSIVGADMTYVEVPTYGLIPNHTYYLFIKDTNWTLPSSFPETGRNKLAIDSVYNSTKTALHQFIKNSVVPQPISFTIPENSDYLLVGGRAAVGTNIEFYISDVNQQDIVVSNAPIPLNRFLGYGMNLLFSVISGYGDAACYNNLIFQFIDGNQYVYVHDASNGTLIQTIMMPNPNSGYHNNSVSFGSEKYDVNDTYPLLYASQESSAQNKCIVYRITGSQGSYEMTVVQTITYPTNAQTGMNYHNCYIDTKNNYLLLGGLINYPYSSMDGNTLQYMTFELPTLSAGNITLQMSDMLFKSGQFTKMPTTQGGFCQNGYLYQVFGVSGSKLLMIYDIKNCKYCYVYDLAEVYNNEPEGAFEYNNAIHIVFVGGRIYKFGILGLL